MLYFLKYSRSSITRLSSKGMYCNTLCNDIYSAEIDDGAVNLFSKMCDYISLAFCVNFFFFLYLGFFFFFFCGGVGVRWEAAGPET